MIRWTVLIVVALVAAGSAHAATFPPPDSLVGNAQYGGQWPTPAVHADEYSDDAGYICTDNGTSLYVQSVSAALARFPDAIGGTCVSEQPPVLIPENATGQTFLCMSHYGGVPVAFDWADVTGELAAGWFVPSAVLGNSSAWDNVGGYHLVCNTDGLHATGTGLNGSGGDAADLQDKATWALTQAEYGKVSPNHYPIYA